MSFWKKQNKTNQKKQTKNNKKKTKKQTKQSQKQKQNKTKQTNKKQKPKVKKILAWTSEMDTSIWNITWKPKMTFMRVRSVCCLCAHIVGDNTWEKVVLKPSFAELFEWLNSFFVFAFVVTATFKLTNSWNNNDFSKL